MLASIEAHAVEYLGWAVVVAVWLGCMVVVWQLSSRLTQRRWAPFAATAVVIWLPFWDFIPGFLAWDAANQLFGGLHVYQSVAADGYLDLSRGSALEVWGMFAASPYQYIEIYSSRRPLSSDVDPAYYSLHLESRDSPECTSFEESRNAQIFHRAFGMADRCPIATRRDAPFSRYVMELSAGWQTRYLVGWFRPMEERWVRVVDHDTNTTLGDARVFRYRPWLDVLGMDVQFENAADSSSIDQYASRLIAAVIKPTGTRWLAQRPTHSEPREP